MAKRKIALTLGDPCSIGPEVFLKAVHSFEQRDNFEFHIFGSKKALVQSDFDSLFGSMEESLHWHESSSAHKTLPLGSGSEESAAQSLEDLQNASKFCLLHPGTNLVTGPVHKAWCSKIQLDFRGQTKMISDLCEVEEATMMLAGESLRVSLVTTHIPLTKVAEAIRQPNKIEKCLVDTQAFLDRIQDNRPIAICGLNPHASDGGLMGNEESLFLEPVLKKLRLTSPRLLEGPLSPDTAFCAREQYSGFICMYHDQALIPLKLLHFDSAVNLSLGLPFLRASVDHGTAFEIAGKNKANFLSYLNAIRYASQSFSS